MSDTDRDEVVKAAAKKEYIHDAQPLGNAVIAVLKRKWSEESRYVGLTDLMEDHGWYVAGAFWFDNGHVLLLAPAGGIE